MLLPIYKQKLITQFVNQFQSGGMKYLTKEQRHSIYKIFGAYKVEQIQLNSKKILVMSEAARMFGWLAILTARKVIVIWQRANVIAPNVDRDCSYDPVEMLEVAEGILRQTLDVEKANDALCNKFYFGIANLETLTTERTFRAMYAAYAALQVIFDGIEGLLLQNSDFASIAMKAYSLREDGLVGLWDSDEFLSEYEYRAQKIDSEKETQFWEWWLTEAIPQAWELTQETYNPQ